MHRLREPARYTDGSRKNSGEADEIPVHSEASPGNKHRTRSGYLPQWTPNAGEEHAFGPSSGKEVARTRWYRALSKIPTWENSLFLAWVCLCGALSLLIGG